MLISLMAVMALQDLSTLKKLSEKFEKPLANELSLVKHGQGSVIFIEEGDTLKNLDKRSVNR